MAAYRRLFLFSALSIFTALCAGCGSSSNQTAGTPQGNFSLSNFSGTYAFTTNGTNSNGSTTDFFSAAGSLQANGSGSITGGTIDINSPATSQLLTNSPITGSYTVGADGRGAATINTTIGTFHLDFVLISNSHGMVTRFDTTAIASGSLDLQTTTDFSLTSLAGTFAFGLSGVDSGGNSEVNDGSITIDASGDITTGIQDVNNDGLVSSSVAITAETSAVAAPNGTSGRGTIAVTSTLGTFTFAYYVISNTELDVMEIDSNGVLAGQAFSQTSTTIPAGAYVFTDSGNTASGPLAIAGILNVDGAGNIQNTSEEDVNSAGTTSQGVPIGGTYSAITSGRGTATVNGDGGTTTFAIYPSSGGILLLETDAGTDSGFVTSGIAVPQTGSNFSTASINGIYGLGLSGVNTNGPVALTAQFTATGSSGSLSGALDLNNSGTLANDLALTGTYSVASSNGRGTASLQTSSGTIDVVFYAISSSQAVFAELDNGEVATGSFQLQQ